MEAVELAVHRGAKIVGLGPASVVTGGGRSLVGSTGSDYNRQQYTVLRELMP